METLARYRLLLVTFVLGALSFARVAFPDVVFPSDEDVRLWTDSLLGVGGPIAWVVTYYFTDTSAGSFSENK